MVIVFSPITDIFSDALWDDNITGAQHDQKKTLSSVSENVTIKRP
jgi:hypothetical protein